MVRHSRLLFGRRAPFPLPDWGKRPKDGRDAWLAQGTRSGRMRGPGRLRLFEGAHRLRRPLIPCRTFSPPGRRRRLRWWRLSPEMLHGSSLRDTSVVGVLAHGRACRRTCVPVPAGRSGSGLVRVVVCSVHHLMGGGRRGRSPATVGCSSNGSPSAPARVSRNACRQVPAWRPHGLRRRGSPSPQGRDPTIVPATRWPCGFLGLLPDPFNTGPATVYVGRAPRSSGRSATPGPARRPVRMGATDHRDRSGGAAVRGGYEKGAGAGISFSSARPFGAPETARLRRRRLQRCGMGPGSRPG